jgi:hypothetical protein
MTAQDEMQARRTRGGQAQRDNGHNDDEGTPNTKVSGVSDEGTKAREAQGWMDDLSEIAHKPDD